MGNLSDLHDVLVAEVSKLPKNDVALCLSSGVDSESLMFAMIEADINPHIYSFTLDDRESTDFSVARLLAKEYNLRFTKVELPTDIERLISDCYLMARRYDARKKTEFECTWPFLYLYPLVEEKYVVTGINADCHFCLSKKGQMHYKDRVGEYRDMCFSNPRAGQKIQRGFLAQDYGKINVDVYRAQSIIDCLDGHTWDELNKPLQKMPIRNAFKQFSEMPFRKHSNFQLGDSGIAEHFGSLLNTRLNIGGKCKSVVGIYNRIIRDANSGAQIFV